MSPLLIEWYQATRKRMMMTDLDIQFDISMVPDEILLESWNLDILTITDVTRRMAWLNTPQRSPEWFRFRSPRITASIFGSIAGNNPYQSQEDTLRRLVWPELFPFPSSPALTWGTTLEESITTAYLKWAPSDTRVVERGIWIPSKYPFLGVSPDGIAGVQLDENWTPTDEHTMVTDNVDDSRVYCLEYKAPWSRRTRPVGGVFYKEVTSMSGNVRSIPPYYMDQITGQMACMGLSHCHFCVFTPSGMQLQWVKLDHEDWTNRLLPTLRDFYNTRYIPSLIRRLKGVLLPGHVV
jgi:putative phage-type endonuclease